MKLTDKEKLKQGREKYRTLRQAFFKFSHATEYPRKVILWTYPCDNSSYSMEYLRERVNAAARLGYDTMLFVDADNKLRVDFVTKRPAQPSELLTSDYTI